MSYGASRNHSCGLELTNGTKVLDGIVPEQEYPPGMIAGVGPRHAQPFVTDQGIRALLLVVIAISCASCRTDAQLDPIQTASDRDTAVISAQEDCLYREVGRLLEPKGSPPVSLQNIAVAAAHFCSQDSITASPPRFAIHRSSREKIKPKPNSAPLRSVWNYARKRQAGEWPAIE